MKVKATVGATGSVVACEVISGSGYTELDIAACEGMRRYGRFDPAHDAAGAATEGEFITTIVYSLN